MSSIEIPDEVDHLIRSVKVAYGLGRWFADDVRLYVRKNIPRWKREFEYFLPMILEGKTPLDVYNMTTTEYAEFRQKLPFVKNANSDIFFDENISGDYNPRRFVIHQLYEDKK